MKFKLNTEFKKHDVYVWDVHATLSVHEHKVGLYLMCVIGGKFSTLNKQGTIQLNEKLVYDHVMSFEQKALLDSAYELSPISRTYKNALQSLLYSTCGDLIQLYSPDNSLNKLGVVLNSVGETPKELIVLTTQQTFKSWDDYSQGSNSLYWNGTEYVQDKG